ncbi:hypothetical protein B566_EDAN004368 [Ephemera danica]|nr:hypothetical protein B566_EDAN004368 [Ephemera danica]
MLFDARYEYQESVVMLMFREEKSPEDEIKAWQFWHGRQHSVKQRILDAGMQRDAKAASDVAILGRLICTVCHTCADLLLDIP